MKIADYIELVKQAETVNEPTGNIIPVSSLSTEGLTPEQKEVANMGLNSYKNKADQVSGEVSKPAKPAIDSELYKPIIDPWTGQVVYNPIPGVKGVNNFLNNHLSPEFGKIYTGRSDGTKGWLSKIHPALEGAYIPPPFEIESLFPKSGQKVNPDLYKPIIDPGTGQVVYNPANPKVSNILYRGTKNIAKAVANTPFELFNSLNAPARFIDTSGLGLAFSLLEPAQAAKDRAEIDAYDLLRRNGFTPSENVKLPLGFEVNMHPGALAYYPYLVGEYLKEAPQAIPTWASFSSPAAPIAIVSDMGINAPYRWMTGSDDNLLPGFWHAQGRPTRARSNQEYEEEENELSHLGELLPGILKTNDRQYGIGNLLADSVGGYLDPVFQWPFGFWYGDRMRNLAELMERPDAVHMDEFGKTTVDYRDLFSKILGSKSVYEQEGGRPELRHLSDNDRFWHIDKLKEAAAKMGYTRDEIDNAVLLYDNPNSLLYKGANLLSLMGMPASDVYNSMYMGDIATEPGKYIPRYLPYNYTGGPALGTPQENPKWVEINKQLLRRLGDQETLFKMSPFFKALKGSKNQLSPEEEEFLNDPEKGIAFAKSLGKFPVQGLIRPWNSVSDLPNINSIKVLREKINSLKDIINTYKGPNDPYIQGVQKQLSKNKKSYDDIIAAYEEAYYLNRIARLPYNYRYAYLLANPERIQPFLNKYYTNEETKQRIKNFLIPE